MLGYAEGRKTFLQVKTDANNFKFAVPELSGLVDTNAARGVARRLAELTGISKACLHHKQMRYKSGAAQHPFVLPSHIDTEMSCV